MCELFVEEIIKYDVICLQETKTDRVDIDTINVFADKFNYVSYVKNRVKSKHKSGGLVTLVKKELSHQIVPCKCVANCMQLFNINANLLDYDTEVLLGNLYIPPKQSPYSRVELFDDIELDLLNLSCCEKGVILCGDFNSIRIRQMSS